MAIVILEGVDRSGKSSVAKLYEAQGFKVVHMSAPDKKYAEHGYVGPSYLDDYLEMMASWGIENVVLDRSAYGELIWPRLYGRTPQLSEDDIEAIAEVENAMGVERILMEDPNQEAHWQRCVDNNEPLNKTQFITARAMYNTMAKNWGFTKRQLSDFKTNEVIDVVADPVVPGVDETVRAGPNDYIKMDGVTYEVPQPKLTPEQEKLAKANAINAILSKSILKAKGPEYAELEKDIRGFLNTKLGVLLGSSSENQSFNKDEVEVLKLLCTQLKQKEQLKNGRK